MKYEQEHKTIYCKDYKPSPTTFWDRVFKKKTPCTHQYSCKDSLFEVFAPGIIRNCYGKMVVSIVPKKEISAEKRRRNLHNMGYKYGTKKK